ncbi:MAG: ImmA/IrrE family metallo-endopeptidase [Chloroflexota bacterium]
MLEAAGLLEDLGVDQTEPIDVFWLIEQLDIWLTFVPLGTTLGACLPVGRGGIMITTRRQPAVQRFTAAHEIGHWILDHGRPWVDDEEAILRPSAPERERIAQLFASYVVMPPPLVDATAAHHGIGTGPLPEPPQAYLVARDMGVSYEAAVRQMAELGVISTQDRDRLLHVSPLAAKRALAHGARPVVGNADVWPIDERWNGARLDVTTADEIVIALPENRTTGFRWMTPTDLIARDKRHPQPAPPPFADGSPVSDIDARPDQVARDKVALDDRRRDDEQGEEPPLQVVTDQYVPGGLPRTSRETISHRRALASAQVLDRPAPRIGATGRRWLSVQARTEGTWRYELAYAPAHEPLAPAVLTFLVEATVHPTPSVAHARSLLAAAPADDAPGGPSR